MLALPSSKESRFDLFGIRDGPTPANRSCCFWNKTSSSVSLHFYDVNESQISAETYTYNAYFVANYLMDRSIGCSSFKASNEVKYKRCVVSLIANEMNHQFSFYSSFQLFFFFSISSNPNPFQNLKPIQSYRIRYYMYVSM